MGDEAKKEESRVHEACKSMPPAEPRTLEEARFYHNGYLAGLTVYARECGHSTLKSQNELLKRLMEEQGLGTLATLEKLGGDDLP